ncbi:BioY family transporter [Bacillus sp. AFS073361]|uniref:biotin transporter BioY n=1 Tax=Bacillus sp. AFS073361 TaxID=2033511 RepID=UPI000BF4BDF5|nr:biotin transporter BioY [Bacillus sp. AFS073361]PFP25644.1 BioY family transporter [Bacillus sp. AFS073361]HWL26312.1 biotin transporter BioY [Ureibacillus sp.]
MLRSHNQLKMWILSALFAAIIGILAQVTIPLPLVPITGQTLAVGLAATILGSRYGTLSVIFYALLGSIGIPVFSGMSGGFGVIVGPTGGYIIGFIPAAFLTGYILEKTSFSVMKGMIANTVGMFVTLVIGTIWLKLSVDMTWTAAFTSGFLPFIVVGLIKAFLASWIGITVYKRLVSAKLLSSSNQITG